MQRPIRVMAYAKGKFAWPLPEKFRISSNFGYRIHPITGKKKLHAGTDIAAPKGTKIMAAGNGEVIVAKYYGGYGNAVIVDHNGKWTIIWTYEQDQCKRRSPSEDR